MRFFKIVCIFNLCGHIISLTIFFQSAVYKLCSRAEKRLKIELRMVCSFYTMVCHLHVGVELLTRVDPVSTCCSVQHVSHTQR